MTLMLFSTVEKNPAITANELNQDLETISQWAYQWKMEFNPDPTKQATELLFSCKKTLLYTLLFSSTEVSLQKSTSKSI